MELFKKMDNLKEEKTFVKQTESVEHVKCLILGSGPAGYTAAIYAARANLHPVLYEGLQPGGQLTTTTEVENFPGYPNGITGTEIMEELKQQALRFKTDVRFGMATEVDFTKPPHKVVIDNKKVIHADTVIIATGASARYLGIEAESKYAGSGVSACATCDGFFYRGKDVVVVGGGDTACEEALYLSNLCNKVYLVVRKPFLRASKIMQQRVMNKANIEILFEHQPKDLFGEGVVEGAVLIKKAGSPEQKEVRIKVDGFFLAIGHTPNSEIFRKYLSCDEIGYILTTPGTSKTNVEGVFACGDVQDKHYRQAVTAAGSGCIAAIDAERYLSEKN
jgi:thioredoxin reductase (NADPH)